MKTKTSNELTYIDYPNGMTIEELAKFIGKKVAVKYYHYSHHNHLTAAEGVVSATERNSLFVDNVGEGVFYDEIRKFVVL